MKIVPCLTLLALLVGGASCAWSDGEDALPPAGNVSDLPSSTAEDWVSYLDAVVVLRLEGIEEMPPPEEAEVEPGSGRRYSEFLLVIEEVLWSNLQPGDPTPTEIRHPQVTRIESANGNEDRTFAFLARGGTEIGDRFLAPISWHPEWHFGARWFWANDAIFPLDGDTVRSDPKALDIEGRLAGMTLDEVASMLADTRPHPYVDQVLHLPPSQRAREVVYRAQTGSPPPPLPPSTPG